MSRPSHDVVPVAGRMSVVVPTRNNARTIARCLRSVRLQTHDNVELIVVDNHSDDATAAIAAEHADRVMVAGPERSAQRNIGAAASSGEWVCFIDSDMVLTANVVGDAVALMRRDPTTAAIIVPERAVGAGFWVRCRDLEKRCYDGSEAEAARVYRRDVFLEAGGYDEELTGGEDWDLPDRLLAAGHRIGRVRAVINHDEGRPTLAEVYRKKRYYGGGVTRYLSRHKGRAVRRFVRTSLLSRPRLLLAAPHVTAGMFVLKAAEAAGLLTGMVRRRAH